MGKKVIKRSVRAARRGKRVVKIITVTHSGGPSSRLAPWLVGPPLPGSYGDPETARGPLARVIPLLRLPMAPRMSPTAAAALIAADPRFGPGRRHLLYHVMPTRGTGVWQLNIERLRKRIELFDGIRSVAVMTSSACDPPEVVQEFLRDIRVDNWILQPNIAKLREVASWAALWQTLYHVHDDSFVFYAHAKGAGRHRLGAATAVHRWARLLYAANLDYWPVVEELLRQYPVVGALKVSGYVWRMSRAAFCFAGSFFWGRIRDCLPRSRLIERWWCGVEAWPGAHFPLEQAGCVFGAVGLEADWYQLSHIASMETAFERWCADLSRTDECAVLSAAKTS